MGEDGFVWVWYGAQGTGGHKNKTSRAKNSHTGYFCDTMAGEISPDIMFYDFVYVWV